jgi:hypothetical protein
VLYNSSHDYLFQSNTSERLPIPVKTNLGLSLLELEAYIALLFRSTHYHSQSNAMFYIMYLTGTFDPFFISRYLAGYGEMTAVEPKG